MEATVVDAIAHRIATALESGDAVPSAALTLLLRRFLATGSDSWRAGLEAGLSRALASQDDWSPGWVIALVEALAVTDASTLRETVAERAGRLRAGWPSRGPLLPAVWGVEACLAAGEVLEDTAGVAAAVDELERMVSLSYEPGDGLAQTLRTTLRQPGDLPTHVATAFALLRAFDVTGRLAYPMLAEELMRPWLSAVADGSAATFDAARVLFRLARLQADPDYLASAVTRADAGYERVGRHLLSACAAPSDAPLHAAAAYGLAMEEWLRRT